MRGTYYRSHVLTGVTFLALSFICGCETIHGGSGQFGKIDRPADLTCIDQAVKSTPQIEYVVSKEAKSQAKPIWNKPIDHFDYRVEFFLREVPSGSGAVSWNESHSVDPSPSYNRSSLGAIFGHTNGRSYTPNEKKLIQSSLDSLGDKIKSSCGLRAEFKTTIH